MSLDRRSLLAAAAALPLAGRVSAPTADSLRQLADPARPDTVMGFGVIARDGAGRPVLEQAHGSGRLTIDGALQARPFALDTPMRIASITKLVAMTGLMTLVEQGRLSLDDDAGALAGFPLRHPAHPDVRVTPAMLASHTSGLRNGPSYPVPLGRPLSGAFVPGGRHYDDGAWFSPAAEPPGFFAYADVNFAVLAQIAERVSGERFDRFLKRTVLDPAGLDAGLNWSGVSDPVRARASAACRPVDGRWEPQVDGEVAPAPAIRVTTPSEAPGLTADDYVPGDNGFVFSPQGGLRASVADLDRLARSYAGHADAPQIVSRRTVEQMSAPLWTYDPVSPNGHTDRGLLQSYGLSVHIPTGRAGDDFFGPGSANWRGHFGQAYGLQSGLFWNILDGRTFAYMISGTPRDAEGLSGARSAASPWEEVILDAALAAWAGRA
ncbi:serine hydrolase domain-containing protein [Brevundimonas lenta]|uniref:CubicO group peptidase (Beta-lactamase class C family) n=1 Tax=Brevundimonas lenta TaxID=424796 RepID=A0A7W6JB91_9CAUL|nr:serine hydrolase [Brevundimonas lenta]MBB4081936.1 CubicO group peptidase (beta-lactamase class C family) [Brevundimonas lenta]